MATLLTYRWIWVARDDYMYECTWSDGDTTMEVSLPWGRLGNAVELK